LATDTRLKIAVFIDFDNIEIGVKSTLGGQFDIGVVLEALKERGEVVSKIAYGDWTRAGDFSRSLTQHATKLVQRNLTPGGDKNGADINLALDALETVFTHSHINAYVIVGGDSDFITLVEKLKQYDKQVFVVGGRSFTSMVMQRNCHEFIAYENLVGSRRSAERGRHSGPVQQVSIDQALPLVRRALKVLNDREVTPQLGLLKSTLLQLDSTFSERTYGVSSFRDFAEKLAAAGHVTLRESGRNVLVELRDDGGPAVPQERRDDGDPQPHPQARAQGEPRAADGVREVRRLFQSAQNPPRWPMYMRQLKQFLRNVDSSFDERKFGFAQLGDLVRASQREGLFRVERDRQGVIRVFPGNVMQPSVGAGMHEDDDNRGNVAPPRPVEAAQREEWAEPEPVSATPFDEAQPQGAEPEVVEAAVVQEIEVPTVVDGEEAERAAEPPSSTSRARKRGRGGRSRATAEGKPPREAKKAADTGAPRARKTSAKPRAPRARANKPAPTGQ
jgi:uncharacterized LabA/DUF88 family protein